jgi:hypothetical protein
MNILSSGVFWGLILILIGISIIVRIVFNVDIPIFRLVIGLLLVYFGFQVIFGGSYRSRRRIDTQRGERSYRGYNIQQGNNQYNIVFSRGRVDLTDKTDLSTDQFVEVNVVFGSAVVLIDPEIPTQIEVNTVFGSASLPGRKLAMIGQERYRVGADRADGSILYIEVSSVFANVEFIEKKTDKAAPEESSTT